MRAIDNNGLEEIRFVFGSRASRVPDAGKKNPTQFPFFVPIHLFYAARVAYLQELRSILHLLKIPHRLPNIDQEESTPFIHIELPNDECAKQLAARSISIRYVLEQWASATSLPAFHAELKQFLAANETNPNVSDNFDASKTFRITVETFNNTMQHKEKIEKIETLAYMPMQGDVSLSNPNVHWYYVEYYGLDTVNVPEQPFQVLFGKWVSSYSITSLDSGCSIGCHYTYSV